jgi:AFG3 family protein
MTNENVDKKEQQPQMPEFNLGNLVWIGVPLAFLLYNSFGSSDGNSQQISWHDFRVNMLDKGYVDRLEVVNKQVVRVYLRPDAPAQLSGGRGSHYYFTIGTFVL